MGIPFQDTLRRIYSQNVDEAMLGKGYKFIRFADDYVVLCKTRQVAQDALELSEQVLERLLLALDEKDIVSFEQGFTYLGVTFVGSMIMTPFERPKKNHRVLFYPDPLDMGAYLRDRMKDSGGIRGFFRKNCFNMLSLCLSGYFSKQGQNRWWLQEIHNLLFFIKNYAKNAA